MYSFISYFRTNQTHFLYPEWTNSILGGKIRKFFIASDVIDTIYRAENYCTVNINVLHKEKYKELIPLFTEL